MLEGNLNTKQKEQKEGNDDDDGELPQQQQQKKEGEVEKQITKKTRKEWQCLRSVGQGLKSHKIELRGLVFGSQNTDGFPMELVHDTTRVLTL